MFRKNENAKIFKQALLAIFKYFSRRIWFSRTFQACADPGIILVLKRPATTVVTIVSCV